MLRPYIKFLPFLEFRTVYPAALRSADLVDHREFETAIAAAFFAEAGGVDIIAESNPPVFKIKPGGEDNGIHQDGVFKVAGQTHPGTELERLVVIAVHIETETGTAIDFHRWALVEKYSTGDEADITITHRELTTGMQYSLVVILFYFRTIEGKIGVIEVIKCTANVEVRLLA